MVYLLNMVIFHGELLVITRLGNPLVMSCGISMNICRILRIYMGHGLLAAAITRSLGATNEAIPGRRKAPITV